MSFMWLDLASSFGNDEADERSKALRNRKKVKKVFISLATIVKGEEAKKRFGIDYR